MQEVPISEEDRALIRRIQLEMLSEVEHLCSKYHIHYCIGYGTMLGAVRHKGYIPWDDDADILMLRKDYEKFKRCCQKNLKFPLFLQDYQTDKEYLWGYAKLRNLNTTYIRAGQEHIKCRNGVFIDIFPLDGVPELLPLQIMQDFLCFVLRKCLWAKVRISEECTGLKKMVYSMLSKISKERIYRIYEKLVAVSNRTTHKRVRCLLFTAPGKHWNKKGNRLAERYGFKRSWIQKCRKYEFENLDLWGSEEYHQCLTYLYGDYMTLPPQEKRVAHAPVSSVDLSRIWNDTKYWDDIYKENSGISTPSLFAAEAAKMMKPESTVADLGCGSGRDCIFFSEQNYKVTAVDLSSEAIKKVSEKKPDITAVNMNFVKFLEQYHDKFDYLYSRFSLHAISELQELSFIKNAYCALKENGKLLIEARSLMDERYGKGEKVGKNTFRYEGHVRRFIDIKELEEHLKSEGFLIEKMVQSRGFAPYENEDPIVIRAVCKKEK